MCGFCTRKSFLITNTLICVGRNGTLNPIQTRLECTPSEFFHITLWVSSEWCSFLVAFSFYLRDILPCQFQKFWHWFRGTTHYSKLSFPQNTFQVMLCDPLVLLQWNKHCVTCLGKGFSWHEVYWRHQWLVIVHAYWRETILGFTLRKMSSIIWWSNSFYLYLLHAIFIFMSLSVQQIFIWFCTHFSNIC